MARSDGVMQVPLLHKRLTLYCAAAAALMAVVWGIAYWAVATEQDQKGANEAERAKRLSGFFEQHVLAIFRYSDNYVKAIRRVYATGSVDAARKLMTEIPPDVSIITHVTIIDETGKPVLVSGHRIRPGSHARDRGYFKFQKNNRGDDVFISLPLRGRNSGILTVRVVRRITRADGSFGGVVFAALKIAPITDFFTAMKLGPRSSATLVGTDKRIRARSTYGRLGPGQDISGSRIWRELERSPVGLYKQTSVVDGITRYYAYRKLSQYPLIVAIGVSLSDISQSIIRYEYSVYVIAALTTLVFLVLIILIGRETLTRRALEARIAERRAALEALGQSEAQLRLVTDAMPAYVSYVDRDRRVRFANKPFAECYGYSVDEIIGKDLSEVRGEELFRSSLPVIEMTLAGEPTVHDEEQGISPNGEPIYHRAIRTPHFDDRGNVQGYVAVVQDITKQRQQEEQLRQSQKMEAIGQLTGGVAHDFNNLLTVSIGNLELLADRLDDDESRRYLQNAMKSALQGAELVQRLLAFSRKQDLAPKAIDLNALVDGMSDLLDRSLGETIEIKVRMGGDLWLCAADPGQLQNAILNLAINARDAMPRGGTLTIETGNVHLDGRDPKFHDEVVAGDYVLAAITDTGTGMPDAVSDRAFDPFFTTKEVGKGSGLGLSMIYGFVRQSDGHVIIETAEGSGTTVTLYLPRSMETAERAPTHRVDREPTSRGEKVLVVEDDPNVRSTTVTMLRDLGYDIVEVGNGLEAVETLRQSSEIDLVLTDVVLPGGMNGADVAREATQHMPGIKVLYVSGYSGDILARHGEWGEDVELIAKPFKKADLARKIRTVLDPPAI